MSENNDSILFPEAAFKAFVGLLPFFGDLILNIDETRMNNAEKAALQKWKQSVDDELRKHTSAIEEFKNEVMMQLCKINEENLTSPLINIVGPAFENARYHIRDEKLRRMFARLIVSSMDRSRQASTHPAFAEITNQLSPFDARFLDMISRESIPDETVRSTVVNGISYVVAELQCCRYPDGTASQSSRLKSNLIEFSVFNKTMKDFCFPFNYTLDEYKGLLNRASISFENLLRLNLIASEEDITDLPARENFSKSIYMEDFVNSANAMLKTNTPDSLFNFELKYRWHLVTLTQFGVSFCNAVFPKSNDSEPNERLW